MRGSDLRVIFVVGLCIGLTYYVTYMINTGIDLKYQNEASEYPSTDAVIISKNYTREYRGDDPDYYHPKIAYTYIVENVIYTNNVFSSSKTNFQTEFEVESILENYTVGQIITIYYNPDNPIDSFIVKGGRVDLNQRLITLIIFIIIALISVIYLSIPDVNTFRKKLELLKLAEENQVDYSRNYSYPSQSEMKGVGNSSIELMEGNKLNFLTPLLQSKIITHWKLYVFALNIFAYIIIIDFNDLYKYKAAFGTYPDDELIEFTSWSIIITFFMYWLYQYSKFANFTKYKFISAIISILISPVVILLLQVPALILLIIYSVVLLIAMLITLFLYFGLINLLNLFQINMSDNGEFMIFLILYSLSILGIGVIHNYYHSRNLCYYNYRLGGDWYDYVFSNGTKAIYSFDVSPGFTVLGDVDGNITWFNEYSMMKPNIANIHESSVLQLVVLNELVFTIATDNSLLISQFDGERINLIGLHEFNSTPTALVVAENYIFVGLSNGMIYLLELEDNNLTLINFLRISDKSVKKIKLENNLIYIATDKEIYSMTKQFEGLELIIQLDREEIITDFTMNSEKIIYSSREGRITFFNRITKELRKASKFIFLYSVGVSSLCLVDQILFIGSTDGTLYRMEINNYKVEKKNNIFTTFGLSTYKIHNLNIEEIKIIGQSLYTISADGTLKIFYLGQYNSIDKADRSREKTEKIILGFCVICKLDLFEGQLYKQCNNCENYYHKEHYADYIVTQHKNNREPLCVVCKVSLIPSW